jgi:pyruvate/2-oxoglutarate dehydrogenase complex dihydrolipoamide acyltransferase (E2) component
MVETIKVAIPHETVNDETVRILSWKVISGAFVEKEQFLCEVETSKAVMEIHAPEAGKVQYTAAVGDEVPVGSIICEIIAQMQAGLQKQPEFEIVAIATEAERKAPVTDLPPARFTPLARNVAADCGIDPAVFPPGTLVRSSDVLLKAGNAVPKVETRPEWSAPSQEKALTRDDGRSKNVAVAGVPVDWVELPRRKIVEGRILGMGQTASIPSSVTLICRAARLRERADQLGLAAGGMTALIVFEVARLLQKYPMFNGFHDRGRMGQYLEVNIGWAIDGGQGLVVPVVKNADRKSLREIANVMEQHVEAYVGNSLTPADFLGGTFTVSDLSGEGISLFQPLISQGQSAILGVGSDGEGSESLYLTLAFDHQLTEGRKGAQFLRELAGRLEAHAALERTPTNGAGTAQPERHCVVCQRDESALKKQKAFLVKSELPPGSVCSLCLAGYR